MTTPTTPTAATDPDPESGRILLLTLGFVVVSLMLVAMVVSATAVHLDRKRLMNLADVAAADAAQALDMGFFGSTAEAPTHVTLTGAQVRTTALDAVASNVALGDSGPHMTQIRVVDAGTPDGVTAEVTLAAVTNPPLLGWFTDTFLDGIDLTATSRARASVTRDG